jgi:hypothetical protein
MPTPKIFISIVLRPFICYGRELISFRSPTVTPPDTAAVEIHGPQIQKAVQIIEWRCC